MDLTTTPVRYLPRLDELAFLEIDEKDLVTPKLYLKLIQSPTREFLLSRHRLWATATRDGIDADTLLADLRLLAPSVAKDYIPRIHTETSFPFRLLKDVDYHGEEEGYIALSCCLKNSIQYVPRKIVQDLPFGLFREAKEMPLPTSAVIFEAVLREKGAKEGLWFDQIGVEQEDDAESVPVIEATSVIYSNARVVFVALDDIVVSLEEEQFLRYYMDQYSHSDLPADQQSHARQKPPFMDRYPIFASFFGRFIQSEWFQRAWYVHEMRLERQYVFLLQCSSQYEGEVQAILRFTTAFISHMLVLTSELNTFTDAQKTRIEILRKLLLDRINSREKQSFAVQRPESPQSPTLQSSELVPTIIDIFQMKVSGNQNLLEYQKRFDANRDKTCIALSAAKLPITLVPGNPYQRLDIEDECLRSLLLVGIAARDPVSLCTTGKPLRLHDGTFSWLARPTSLDTHGVRSTPRRFARSSNPIRQCSDGIAEYAQIDLIFLNLPHGSAPNPLYPTHVTRATLFIHLCTQFNIPGPDMWSYWQAPDHPRAASMCNIYIQTLGCIFECGPQWLLDLINSPNFSPAPALEPLTVKVLLDPLLIIENYIPLTASRSVLSSLLTCISSMLTTGIPWASGATECTHRPLIVAAPVPSYPPTANGGKAVVFAPFAHSQTLLIAVPDAVKAPEYDGLSRAWVLTCIKAFRRSPNTSVSWILQSKGAAFGDGNFCAMLARSVDTRNHRVYGPSMQM